ncbi:hypothetical protein S1361_10330 [Streptomyces cyanogenus]|uniref:Uncharacterized protein n=1 Tax=Streptomyces cyanogenus TaxID=80860 RepID=A0ABX7TQA4_STRCY|nr:hypothetical protein S1361_10330 [Streptomyces cyanogenus]
MRRRPLLTVALAAGPAALKTAPATARDRRVLHVRPGDSVQATVYAVDGPGRTLPRHPGTYREVVHVAARGGGGITPRRPIPPPDPDSGP